jgi:hypothetical protein
MDRPAACAALLIAGWTLRGIRVIVPSRMDCAGFARRRPLLPIFADIVSPFRISVQGSVYTEKVTQATF